MLFLHVLNIRILSVVA